jgi:hypothetical protein
MEQRLQEPHEKGVANHLAPSFVTAHREVLGAA